MQPSRLFTSAAGLLAVFAISATAASGQSQPSFRTIARSDGALSAPSVSTDGRWLLYWRTTANRDDRLYVRPATGGEERELELERGLHRHPMLSSDGKRLFFVSNLPRRGGTDTKFYIVAAPFDNTAGRVTGPARQVSLDGVLYNARVHPRLSPDGRWLAYVDCCATRDFRIVPSTGGNPRTLVKSPVGEEGSFPGNFAFSSDSRFMAYQVRIKDTSYFYRMPITGGAPVAIGKLFGMAGPILPDHQHFLRLEGPRSKQMLFVRSMNGQDRASFSVPDARWPILNADGRSIIVRSSDAKATIRIAPVSGGELRTIGAGTEYEWADGWSPDSRTVHITTHKDGFRISDFRTIDGKSERVVKLPAGEAEVLGFRGNHMFLMKGDLRSQETWRIVRRDLTSGAETELAKNVVRGWMPTGPTGMYYGITGDEIYFRQAVANEQHIKAMNLDGTVRLLRRFPRSLRPIVAVHGASLAAAETVGDSTYVRVYRSATDAPIPLLTLPREGPVGDIAWSKDGRKLAIRIGGAAQRILVYSFGEAGALTGPPQSIAPDFEYYYEMFWLPDGTGLTMIAQPKGPKPSEVALIRLTAPGSPVMLTAADKSDKWGYATSPDGKWVAYPSETGGGSVVQQLDLAAILRRPIPKR